MKQIKTLKQYISFNIKTMRDYAMDQVSRDFPSYLREVFKRTNDWALGSVYRKLFKSDPEPLLVICHSRTGSNFLLWLLESHPRIAHIGEPFGTNELVHPWVVSRIHEIGALGYLKERLQRKSNERVTVFKFQYVHFESEYEERWNISGMDNIRTYLTGELNIKVVHLKRRNRLENLISHRLAEVTKKYILFDPKKRVGDLQVEITPDECVSEFEKVAAFEKYYSELFANHSVLEIYYEDLYKSIQSEGRRILDFLGIKRASLRERTVKQNIRPMREVLKNYDELKEHFTGTVWENMFSD
jgi:LPS sulfotransferase NodH